MVEVEQFRLINGDCVLLCTNGLTDMVSDERIADVLALRRQPEEQCAILTDLANQQGGEDNITVVLAAVSDSHRRKRYPNEARPRLGASHSSRSSPP